MCSGLVLQSPAPFLYSDQPEGGGGGGIAPFVPPLTKPAFPYCKEIFFFFSFLHNPY